MDGDGERYVRILCTFSRGAVVSRTDVWGE